MCQDGLAAAVSCCWLLQNSTLEACLSALMDARLLSIQSRHTALSPLNTSHTEAFLVATALTTRRAMLDCYALFNEHSETTVFAGIAHMPQGVASAVRHALLGAGCSPAEIQTLLPALDTSEWPAHVRHCVEVITCMSVPTITVSPGTCLPTLQSVCSNWMSRVQQFMGSVLPSLLSSVTSPHQLGRFRRLVTEACVATNGDSPADPTLHRVLLNDPAFELWSACYHAPMTAAACKLVTTNFQVCMT